MKDLIVIALSVVFGCTQICGLVIGLVETYPARNQYVGCKYEALIDFNPSRALVCELLRKRWKEVE